MERVDLLPLSPALGQVPDGHDSLKASKIRGHDYGDAVELRIQWGLMIHDLDSWGFFFPRAAGLLIRMFLAGLKIRLARMVRYFSVECNFAKAK